MPLTPLTLNDQLQKCSKHAQLLEILDYETIVVVHYPMFATKEILSTKD